MRNCWDMAGNIKNFGTHRPDCIGKRDLPKKFLQITKDKTAVIISHRVGLILYADVFK